MMETLLLNILAIISPVLLLGWLYVTARLIQTAWKQKWLSTSLRELFT